MSDVSILFERALTMLVARNDNLTQYLNDFIDKNRLRWTYLRSTNRQKIGCLVTYVDTDSLGRKDLYVGWSKVNQSAGDSFSLDVGLTKAIENSVPCGQFLELVEHHQLHLPRVPLTWRNVRDSSGYITGEVEWFDQYEAFASKLRRIYPTLNLNTVVYSE